MFYGHHHKFVDRYDWPVSQIIWNMSCNFWSSDISIFSWSFFYQLYSFPYCDIFTECEFVRLKLSTQPVLILMQCHQFLFVSFICLVLIEIQDLHIGKLLSPLKSFQRYTAAALRIANKFLLLCIEWDKNDFVVFVELIFDLFILLTFSKVICVCLYVCLFVYSSFINTVSTYEGRTPTWYVFAFSTMIYLMFKSSQWQKSWWLADNCFNVIFHFM